MSDQAEADAFRLARSTSHLLHRAQQLASDRFSFLVGDDGVTLRQFAVLAAIHEHPGLSQTDLVRATGIDRSTLADMVTRMEKRGLITRTASPSDGRAHAVDLAAAGQQMLSSATKHARAADAAILDSLPKNKRRAFQSTLALLAELADKGERATRKEDKKADKKRQQAEPKPEKTKGKERA
ncbi:transcriptional regulator of MarR family [alpha proteobacterium U9-1i]|nr:transcriptional regulator of MarR family [alpha proteobacterium U9-1i]